MFIFRVFGLCALGLIAAVALADLAKGPVANFASDAGMLVFLSVFILLLGPFWPSQKNLDKWAEKSKLNLPTDKPEVALYVFNFLAALFSLAMAWHRYADPAADFWRMERLALRLSGHAGIVAMWLIIAFGFFVGGVVTYRKAAKAKKANHPA